MSTPEREIRKLLESGQLEKAEKTLRLIAPLSPELLALRQEIRIKLSRLCEEIVSGFEYTGRYSWECASLTFKVHEYQHQQTGMYFNLLPPEGISLPISFRMGSSKEELDRLYHQQQPVLINSDVSDSYLPEDEYSHEVTLTQKFLMAQAPTTRAVWYKVMKTRPWMEAENESGTKTDLRDEERLPANFLSWEDAQQFCQKIECLLPSEAQWEYACRAGTQSLYYWGNAVASDYAWYEANTPTKDPMKPQPIQQKKPNAFGLYEMSGNVCEWCSDIYGEYSRSAIENPTGAKVGEKRVARGGSCLQYQETLRSAERFAYSPYKRQAHLGFRVVKILS